MIAVSSTNADSTIRPPSNNPESRLNCSRDVSKSVSGHCTIDMRPGPASTALHTTVSDACGRLSLSTNPAFPVFIWPLDLSRSALPRGWRPSLPQQLAEKACREGNSMSVSPWYFPCCGVKLNQNGDSESLVSRCRSRGSCANCASACAGSGESPDCRKARNSSGIPLLAAYCRSKAVSASSDITAIAAGMPYTDNQYNSVSSVALARCVHSRRNKSNPGIS